MTTRRTLLPLLVFACAWTVLTFTSRAATISMHVTCAVTETYLIVEVVNRGDEPAQNVSAEVAFLDRLYNSPSRGRLGPGEWLRATFPIAKRELTGTYPAVVTVYFEDLNAYPFSSVTVHPVAFGAARVPRIFGTLEGGRLRKKKDLKLRIRNHSASQIDLRCRVMVAREMLADNPERELVLPANGLLTLEVPLENFSVLPGSTYPVYVLLEYDENGEHFCAIASASVNVERALPLMSVGFWVLLLVAVSGIGLAFLKSRAKHC